MGKTPLAAVFSGLFPQDLAFLKTKKTAHWATLAMGFCQKSASEKNQKAARTLRINKRPRLRKNQKLRPFVFDCVTLHSYPT